MKINEEKIMKIIFLEVLKIILLIFLVICCYSKDNIQKPLSKSKIVYIKSTKEQHSSTFKRFDGVMNHSVINTRNEN